MKKRFVSIDILRALAIVEMIMSHIYMVLTKQNYGLYGYFILSIFGTWAEGIFLACAGTGFFVSINKKINENTSKKEIFTYVIKRATLLFVLTLAMLIMFGFTLNMYFTSIIYWSIFQVIAFSMVIFFYIPFLRKHIRRTIMICLIIFIYVAYFMIQYTNLELLNILVSGGVFTYLPWASFYVFGMLMGDLIINTEIDKIKKILIFYLFSGVTLLLLSLFWLFSLNLGFLLILHISAYSGYFLLFSFLYYITDLHEIKSAIQNSLVRWGKVAFSLYYIHFAILVFCLILFPLIINDIYSKGILFYQYLILIVIVITFIEIFLRLWERYDFIFGIEWFMDKLVKKSLFSKAKNR